MYNQEQKPYGRFALAAARYFQAATAAPAPTISDKPPSIGALFGSSGGVGCARNSSEEAKSKINSMNKVRNIEREKEDFELRVV